tara:strand:- start:32 stop:550 length:519 start_codon:yes stop_codon:yes gene_type:complete
MKPSSAKAKGRRLQQRIVSDILKLFPSLEEDDVTSRSMGAGGEDILLSPAARRLFPFSVECKNCERLNVWSAIEQAEANLPRSDVTGLVVFSRNHAKTYVAFEWKGFLALLERVNADTTPVPTQDEAPPTEAAGPSEGVEEMEDDGEDGEPDGDMIPEKAAALIRQLAAMLR